MGLRAGLRERVRAVLRDRYGIPTEVELEPITEPRPWGYSTNVALRIAGRLAEEEIARLDPSLSKKERKRREKALVREHALRAAEELAAELAGELPAGVARVEAENGFVNFYLDPAVYGRELIGQILADPAGLARGEPRQEKVMVEFSQPNTHKPFHVGHLRNTLLGNALSNLLEFAGYPVVRANYYGDIGLHVIKCLWGLMHLGELGIEREEGESEGRFLGRVYSAVDRLLGEDGPERERVEREIRTLHQRWDRRDPEVVDLWEKTRRASLEEFRRIYRDLGVSFELEFFESQVEEAGKEAVRDLLEKGVAEVSQDPEYRGAVFVDLAEKTGDETLGKLVILRADGTTLYSTKDLALARIKFARYGIDRSLYVVASEQSLYFRQIFAILRLWGFPQAERCVHIPYELVVLPEGKMSSRRGTVVLFDELWDRAVELYTAITRRKREERGGEEEGEEENARLIALGAIKYYMLAVDKMKQVVFDFDEALSPDGRSGVYLQYSYVRARRILEKAGLDPDGAGAELVPGEEVELQPAEVGLMRRMDGFSFVVEQALEQLDPSPLAHWAYQLARDFTDFYTACPVIRAGEPSRSFRLALTAAFARLMETVSTRLLSIGLPREM